jgi:peptidoglycan L-alanyl-D-glutamate endopeptidase CwlK
MPKPILHSTLTMALMDRLPRDIALKLVRFTVGGVFPEGANLREPLQPDPDWIKEQERMTDSANPQPGPEPMPEPLRTFRIGDYSIPIDIATETRCQNMERMWHEYCVKNQQKDSGFKFGQTSLLNLHGVYPPLVLLANFALVLSWQDFGVTCGVREYEDQLKAVRSGHSRTMHSMHLPQKDGFAHAVDLVPFTGVMSWDWNLMYLVAAAMHHASYIVGVGGHIRWGGAWDRRLSDFGDKPSDFQAGVKGYALRHAGSDLLDGPHFEWVVE